MEIKSRDLFKRDYLLILGLTLLAVLLRFPGLQAPLEGDEAISFNRYGFQSWREILFYYSDIIINHESVTRPLDLGSSGSWRASFHRHALKTHV